MAKKTSAALPPAQSDAPLDSETPLDAPRPSARSVALVGRILEQAQRLQEPAVAKYVAHLRKAHPDDSPEQIVERLERRFLNTVTASGGVVGATASIPGVGTIAALSALTADTALFIEASALLALATAEVHGISPADAELRRSLVLSVALGEEGVTALGKVVGARGTGALSRLAIPGLPNGQVAKLNKMLTGKLVKKFAVRRAPVLVGKLIPGGVGAVVGGAGNRALGALVVRNARAAFGPPPRFWDLDGVVVQTGPADQELPPAGRTRRLIRGR
ncbi:MAG: hypothetical protein QM658_08790 [Gordonia sp. (in: high G+C Gram-positive bacteria)]